MLLKQLIAVTLDSGHLVTRQEHLHFRTLVLSERGLTVLRI